MLKKILLAFDGSSNAHRAADYALKLAKEHEAEVVILTVREPTPFQSSRVAYNVIELDKEMQKQAVKVIHEAEDKFRDTGIKFVSKILQGDPAYVICEEAEKNGITEIIMGSRGMNPITRLLLGSVSNKVLNTSPCTVIIVK